jgi:hypothetical protein
MPGGDNTVVLHAIPALPPWIARKLFGMPPVTHTPFQESISGQNPKKV